MWPEAAAPVNVTDWPAVVVWFWGEVVKAGGATTVPAGPGTIVTDPPLTLSVTTNWLVTGLTAMAFGEVPTDTVLVALVAPLMYVNVLSSTLATAIVLVAVSIARAWAPSPTVIRELAPVKPLITMTDPGCVAALPWLLPSTT